MKAPGAETIFRLENSARKWVPVMIFGKVVDGELTRVRKTSKKTNARK